MFLTGKAHIALAGIVALLSITSRVVGDCRVEEGTPSPICITNEFNKNVSMTVYCPVGTFSFMGDCWIDNFPNYQCQIGPYDSETMDGEWIEGWNALLPSFSSKMHYTELFVDCYVCPGDDYFTVHQEWRLWTTDRFFTISCPNGFDATEPTAYINGKEDSSGDMWVTYKDGCGNKKCKSWAYSNEGASIGSTLVLEATCAKNPGCMDMDREEIGEADPQEQEIITERRVERTLMWG